MPVDVLDHLDGRGLPPLAHPLGVPAGVVAPALAVVPGIGVVVLDQGQVRQRNLAELGDLVPVDPVHAVVDPPLADLVRLRSLRRGPAADGRPVRPGPRLPLAVGALLVVRRRQRPLRLGPLHVLVHVVGRWVGDRAPVQGLDLHVGVVEDDVVVVAALLDACAVQVPLVDDFLRHLAVDVPPMFGAVGHDHRESVLVSAVPVQVLDAADAERVEVFRCGALVGVGHRPPLLVARAHHPLAAAVGRDPLVDSLSLHQIVLGAIHVAPSGKRRARREQPIELRAKGLLDLLALPGERLIPQQVLILRGLEIDFVEPSRRRVHQRDPVPHPLDDVGPAAPEFACLRSAPRHFGLRTQVLDRRVDGPLAADEAQRILFFCGDPVLAGRLLVGHTIGGVSRRLAVEQPIDLPAPRQGIAVVLRDLFAAGEVQAVPIRLRPLAGPDLRDVESVEGVRASVERPAVQGLPLVAHPVRPRRDALRDRPNVAGVQAVQAQVPAVPAASVNDDHPRPDHRSGVLERPLGQADHRGADLVQPLAERRALGVLAEERTLAHDRHQAAVRGEHRVRPLDVRDVLPSLAGDAGEWGVHHHRRVRTSLEVLERHGMVGDLEPDLLADATGHGAALAVGLHDVGHSAGREEPQQVALSGGRFQHAVSGPHVGRVGHHRRHLVGRGEVVHLLVGRLVAQFLHRRRLVEDVQVRRGRLGAVERPLLVGQQQVLHVGAVFEVEVLHRRRRLGAQALDGGVHRPQPTADPARQLSLERDVVREQEVVVGDAGQPVAVDPARHLLQLRRGPRHVEHEHRRREPAEFVVQRQAGAALGHGRHQRSGLGLAPAVQVLPGLGVGHLAREHHRVRDRRQDVVGHARQFGVDQPRLVHVHGDGLDRVRERRRRPAIFAHAAVGVPLPAPLLHHLADLGVGIPLAARVVGLAEPAEGPIGLGLNEDHDLAPIGRRLLGPLDDSGNLRGFQNPLGGVLGVHGDQAAHLGVPTLVRPVLRLDAPIAQGGVVGFHGPLVEIDVLRVGGVPLETRHDHVGRQAQGPLAQDALLLEPPFRTLGQLGGFLGPHPDGDDLLDLPKAASGRAPWHAHLDLPGLGSEQDGPLVVPAGRPEDARRFQVLGLDRVLERRGAAEQREPGRPDQVDGRAAAVAAHVLDVVGLVEHQDGAGGVDRRRALLAGARQVRVGGELHRVVDAVGRHVALDLVDERLVHRDPDEPLCAGGLHLADGARDHEGLARARRAAQQEHGLRGLERLADHPDVLDLPPQHLVGDSDLGAEADQVGGRPPDRLSSVSASCSLVGSIEFSLASFEEFQILRICAASGGLCLIASSARSSKGLGQRDGGVPVPEGPGLVCAVPGRLVAWDRLDGVSVGIGVPRDRMDDPTTRDRLGRDLDAKLPQKAGRSVVVWWRRLGGLCCRIAATRQAGILDWSARSGVCCRGSAADRLVKKRLGLGQTVEPPRLRLSRVEVPDSDASAVAAVVGIQPILLAVADHRLDHARCHAQVVI